MRIREMAVAVLAVAALVGDAAAKGQAKRPMSYQEAVERFRAIKKGTPSDEVVAALGEPARREGRRWIWDFTKLKGYPGIAVGVQTFPAGSVQLDADSRVERTELAWIDATGPGQ
jgi:hypothetical protein